MLGAFVLTLHDDARGDMDNAHGGVRDIDMLAAMPAGAKRFDAQVRLADDDLDVIGDLWDDKHRCEGSMPTIVGIEGGEANQPMYPGLSFAITIGVFSFDEHGDALNPRLLARQDIEDLRPKPFALGPAQIHAQEHFGPILRFGAA